MFNNCNFDEVYELLLNSETEKEILFYLIKIVKEFDKSLYFDKIKSNPYFNSLLPEVVESIICDIEQIECDLKHEIENIDEKIENSHFDEQNKKILNDLMSECYLLINEIRKRKKSIYNLID
jgi:hypothetical protein